jgi:N-acetylglutamate synthase-like GNAT family acetyltransferase
MTDHLIRSAARADFPFIRSIILAAQINPIGLDWRRFLVVTSPQNKVLGCGQIKPHSHGTRELASIAVRPEERGQGIARKIILALLSRETKRPLHLMCRARLGSLYSKFGFYAIRLEEMPAYFKSICWLERILNSKSRPEDRLLVMRLD